MNPTMITARVSDQHLQLVNVPVIASGGVDVLQIRFEFCGLWTGCGKTAVFYRDEDKVYHVPVDDNLVTVPWEVLVDEGYFYFGVFGVKTNLRPTEVVKIKVSKGALTVATATPEEPTPDIYQQIMAAYGHMEDRLDETISLKDECETAVNTLVLTHDDFVSGGYVEALKELNNGERFLFWVGTEEEYQEDKGSLPANTLCITTDGITADDLRAEVAAFGLGGAALKNWDDVDTITTPGWYRFSKEGGIVIKDTTYNYAYMRVDAYGKTNATQVLYALNSNNLQHTYNRYLQAGAWTVWEKDILEKELLAEKADILATAGTWDNNVRNEVMGAFEEFSQQLPTQYAPTGYGLGGVRPEDTINDWSQVDKLIAPGWYRFYADAGITVNNAVCNYAYMRVDAYNDKHATQTLYLIKDGKRYPLVRHLLNGVWETEWAWVNPPMAAEEVYKTTELWVGKPVYTRRIVFAAETAKQLTLDLGENVLIFRQYAFNNSGALPQFSATGELQADIEIYPQTGTIYYRDIRSAVSGNVNVQIWFTKD